MNAHTTMLSIVMPCHNEEENVTIAYERLSVVLDSITREWELIYVDDGSADATFDVIKTLSARDRRVKCIRLSRNFGSHNAIMAGLQVARGQATMAISADLQDPPELLVKLVERWKEGFHIVWGAREERKDSTGDRVAANLFYFILRRVALPDFPEQGTDCFLFDRKVVDEITKFPDIHITISPAAVWMGFRQSFVYYKRGKRERGSSSWTFGKKVQKAIDIFVSFSYFPVRFVSVMGIAAALLSMGFGIYIILAALIFGETGSGWATIMVVMLFLGGAQLVAIGIIGEYIWRIAEQVAGRPGFIVMDSFGFTGAEENKMLDGIRDDDKPLENK